MTRHPHRFWRRVGAAFFASLLLFSGIANAYCSIDQAAAQSRVDASSAQQTHEAGTVDECPGFPNLAKEDAKPDPHWDAAAAALHGAAPRTVVRAPRTLARVDRRDPIAESVFRRFPRLLN